MRKQEKKLIYYGLALAPVKNTNFSRYITCQIISSQFWPFLTQKNKHKKLALFKAAYK